MSASNANSAIYLTDTAAQIKNKINRHAFSGGQETAELHALHGGNPDVDVAYQYLSFFLDSDEELAQIATDYRSGTLSTANLKKRCIEVISGIVTGVQKRRAGITEEIVQSFMDPARAKVFQLKPASGVDEATIAKLSVVDGVAKETN
jgi:tryptophanyl-tRNA synthetase